MKRYKCPKCEKIWNQDQLPRMLNDSKTKWVDICPNCLPEVIPVKKEK